MYTVSNMISYYVFLCLYVLYEWLWDVLMYPLCIEPVTPNRFDDTMFVFLLFLSGPSPTSDSMPFNVSTLT